VIEPIEIPGATREPAAHVRALARTLGEREPPMAEGEWSPLPRPEPERLLDALEGLRAANLAMLEGVGHDLAHLNQLARTVAAATG
jgi:hypothetical protein